MDPSGSTVKLLSSAGVSWFISAGELRAEARKENRPEEEESAWRPSAAWFEPYSRVKPWREPLRQRQVPEDRNSRPRSAPQAEPDVEPRTKTTASSLDRMSLQVGSVRRLRHCSETQTARCPVCGLRRLRFVSHPAGGSGGAAPRLHLSVQAEGGAPGSAGGGEEATGGVQQREGGTLQPARRTREAAEACRYGRETPGGGSVTVTSHLLDALICLTDTNRKLFSAASLCFPLSVQAPLCSGGLFPGRR